jgi:hypothetical protein
MKTKTTTYSPDQLIAMAAEGRFTKHELADFLAIDQQRPFLEACARVEKQFTEECPIQGGPCLESGCSAEGEICLQPLLHAGSAYYKACAAVWLPIFRTPGNRADLWRH